MAAGDLTYLQEDSGARFISRTRPAYAGTLDANGNPTLTVADAITRRYTVALTGNRTITLSNTNAFVGATFKIIRADTAAQTLDVKNNGGSTLKQIPNSTAATVECVFDGTDWQLSLYSLL